jgi:hypothetical protein
MQSIIHSYILFENRMPFYGLLLWNYFLVVRLLLETFARINHKVLVLSIIVRAFALNVFFSKLINRRRRWTHGHACILIRLNRSIPSLVLFRRMTPLLTRTAHLWIWWNLATNLLRRLLKVCKQSTSRPLMALFSRWCLIGSRLFSTYFSKWGFHFNLSFVIL